MKHEFILIIFVLCNIILFILFFIFRSLLVKLSERGFKYTHVVDEIVHFTMAFLCLLPLYLLTTIRIIPFLVYCACAVLIDLDHFIDAWSLKVRDVYKLNMRPVTHSLLFITLLFYLVYLTSGNLIAGLMVFSALLSHFSFDSFCSFELTPLFYPLKIRHIPALAFPFTLFMYDLLVFSFLEGLHIFLNDFFLVPVLLAVICFLYALFHLLSPSTKKITP